jgi:phage terminase Nu1 subunit (DNA packaging protein)
MADLFDRDTPTSPLFNARTIAALLDISEREIANLAAEGVIPREGPGKYALVGVVQAYCKHLRARSRSAADMLFSQQEIAALLGISVQAFVKWNVSSKEKRGREVLYYWPDVLAARDERDGKKKNGDGVDPRFEQAREHRARADRLELELAERRGELVYVAHMQEIFGRAITAFRARLRGAAAKLAPLVNPKEPNLARDAIDREHDEALAELADFDGGAELAERAARDGGNGGDTPAASAPNGQSVGRQRAQA